MGKNVSPALEAMIANVNTAKTAGKFASVASLAKDAKKDEKTIRRILNGENEPALDTVCAVAKALAVEPWQLIQPAAGETSLEQALEVVARTLDAISEVGREVAAQHLQTLARAPDSKKAMAALLQALTPADLSGTPTAQKLMDMQATVESSDLPRPIIQK